MSFRIDYERELNEQQLEVVTAGDGPVLVIAGAGSGKTRALTYRVSYLIDRGVSPERILLATFTNKAAKEMLERVSLLTGVNPSRITGGTFHHIAHLVLRKYAPRVGIDRSFTIMDREDSESLLKDLIHQLFNKHEDKRLPGSAVVASVISFGINAMLDIETTVERRFSHLEEYTEELKKIATKYHEYKFKLNLLDFDDLLYHFYLLLSRDDEVRKLIASRFTHVLVDEYQDTSRIQAEIVDLIVNDHRNVMVVGDDSQSIYSFRGAEPENMFSFKEKYPDARIYKLEINYRSTPEILNLANVTLENAGRAYAKTLRPVKPSGSKPFLVYVSDEFHEARFVADYIMELERDGVPLEEIAVLYRAHYQSMALQMELTRRGVPFEVRSGIRFFEQAHVKDVLSFLRVTCNSKDELAWKRILKLYPGVGERIAGQIWDDLKVQHDPLRAFIEESGHFSARYKKESLARLSELLRLLSSQEMQENPSAAIGAVVDLFYDEYLRLKYTDYRSRLEDLRQLMEYAKSFSSVGDLVAEMALYSHAVADDLSGQRREKVVLTTVHQAKGLEWQAVILIGLNEGKFPSVRALKDNFENDDEERRLFYVAVTRAKNILLLTVPRVQATGRRYDRTLLKPSRFVEELIEENVVEVEDLGGLYVRNF